MPALLILVVLAACQSIGADRKARFLVLTGFVSSFAIVSALEKFLHYLDYYHWTN